MEWNWLSGNNMTPFLLSESTGDSEEVKSDVHHNHEEYEAAKDEQEGVLFRFSDDQDEGNNDDDDDDAQSCSYDHSSYINTRYGNNMGHDQSQRLISYDDDGGDIGDGEIDDDDDDDKNNDQCQWRSCVHDPSNQREIDRKFWETCLAS